MCMVKVHVYVPRPSPHPVLITYSMKGCKHSYFSSLIAGEACIVAVYMYANGGKLVSCPARTRLPARNGLVNEVEFLGLITQNG